MSHLPDLDAYFERIGYDGPRTATLATLQGICLAHVRAIPFENLDVLLDRPIELAPAAIERKLVQQRRGGYCFEQNSWLLLVLEALGYHVQPISARVRVQQPRSYLPPRTHVFVRVELDGESWLADVGVGAWSLTSPLRLQLDVEQRTRHEPRRLIAEGDWDGLARRDPQARLFHQIRLGAQWHDVCEFTLEEMPPIDRELGNWYTSAHPGSHFKHRLIVARATADGRLTLANREFTRRGPDGVGHHHLVASPDELLAILRDEFGLEFPPGTRFRCSGLDWSAPPPPSA